MSVRIAVIGAGKFGEVHLKVFKQLEMLGVAELKGFATVKQEEIDKFEPLYGVKGYLDYKEMLDSTETDAVSVVTPDFLHREIAVYAANQGKHILVEKPLDITVEGCEEMIRAAKKRIVSVEEIVPTEEIRKHPEKTKIPRFQVDMVIEAPLGAHPTSCAPLYTFDPWHMMKYMEMAASPESFKQYLSDYVMKPEFEYLEAIGGMRQAAILRRLAREVKFL